MTDIAAAPATEAPAAEVVAPPAPISVTHEPEVKPEPPVKVEKPKSIADSVAKATAKVEADEAKTAKPVAEVKAKPAEPVKAAAEKDPATGRFTAKPGDTPAPAPAPDPKSAAQPAPDPSKPDHRVAPSRLSKEARDAWETVPEHVQTETHRALRELEAGINKYKPAAEAYDTTYRAYDELAKNSKVDAKATLDGYIALDRMLTNPQTLMQGMEAVLQAKGLTPQQYAQRVLGQAPQAGPAPLPGAQPSQQESQTIAELRRTVARLEQQVTGVTEHVQTQRQQDHERTISEWAADKPHFEQLAEKITQYVVKDGLLPDDAYVKALNEAQDNARALLGDGGFISPSPAPIAPAAEAAPVQPDKGQKSIHGAPSAGSSPAGRKRSSSIEESVARAIQAVG